MPLPDTSDRSPLASAVRAIINAMLPNLRFMADLEYEVASQSNNFVDLRPTDKQAGLPDLTKVPFRGAPGVAGELTAGTKVVVRFVNSDPGRPYIAAVEGRHEPSFVPTTLRMNASGTAYVGESASTVELAGGAQWAALANLVEQHFAARDNIFNNHVHVESGSTTDPPSVPITATPDVKASKVKVT